MINKKYKENHEKSQKIILSRKTLDKLAAVRYTITCAVKISFLNIKIAVL